MARADVAANVRVRTVVNNFPTVKGSLRRNAEAFVSKAAQDLAGHAKVNIHAHGLIDTGNLLNSIIVEDGAHALQKFVVVGAHYGIYHEMGTRYMVARPFLGPAADAVRPEFVRSMTGLLR